MIKIENNYNEQFYSTLLQLPEEIFSEVVNQLQDLNSVVALKRSCQKARGLIDANLPYQAEMASRLISKLFTVTLDLEFTRILRGFKENQTAITLKITVPLPNLSLRLQQVERVFRGVTVLQVGPQVGFSDTELACMAQYQCLQKLMILTQSGQSRALTLPLLQHPRLEKLVIQGLQGVEDNHFATLRAQLPKLCWIELDGCDKVSPSQLTTLKVCNLQGLRHTKESFLAALKGKVLCVDGSSDIPSETFALAAYPSHLKRASFGNTNLGIRGLAQLFSTSTALQEIALCGCRAIPEEAFVGINWPKSLLRVTLDDTHISDKGFLHLLESCPKLVSLSVKGCEKLSRDALFCSPLPRTMQQLYSSYDTTTHFVVLEQLEATGNASLKTNFALALWNKTKSMKTKEKAKELLMQSLSLCPDFLTARNLLAYLSKGL